MNEIPCFVRLVLALAGSHSNPSGGESVPLGKVYSTDAPRVEELPPRLQVFNLSILGNLPRDEKGQLARLPDQTPVESSSHVAPAR